MRTFELAQTIGRNTAKLINSGVIPLETFRTTRKFKGKLTIAGYLDRSAFPASGAYCCDGLLFDLDFDDDIQKAVYLGLYETRELTILHKLLQPGNCCVDIGANIGLYTLHMARAVGSSGRVYSFEPDPDNYARLQRNISLNGQADRVSSYCVALSSQKGAALFSRTLKGNTGWGRIGEWPASSSRIDIETTYLDDFVSAHNITYIDLLKCDIEGHELEFLRGAQATLSSGILKAVMIEYNGYVLEPRGVVVADYVREFRRFGYEPHALNLDLLAAPPRRATYNLLFVKSA